MVISPLNFRNFSANLHSSQCYKEILDLTWSVGISWIVTTASVKLLPEMLFPEILRARWNDNDRWFLRWMEHVDPTPESNEICFLWLGLGIGLRSGWRLFSGGNWKNGKCLKKLFEKKILKKKIFFWNFFFWKC